MASTSTDAVSQEVLNLPYFVQSPTIELCRKAIANVPGFREVEKDDYVLFNYDFCFRGTFPDPRKAKTVEEALILQTRRECRGIIFDKETGKITSRRFHKFFNVNELDETHEDLIDVTRPHTIMDKMDGCLVSPFMSLGKLRWGSKMGVTELAEEMENNFLPLKHDIKYKEFCMHWIEKGYTPLFEWCSYRQQIIVSYPDDMLVLIAIRNNETGAYITLPEMQKSAAEYGVPVTKPMKVAFGTDYANLGELLNHVKNTTDLEGFVLCFEDGDIYKLKTEWYFARSKKVAGHFTGQEKELWDLILNRKIDDLGGALGAKRTEVLEHQSLLLWQALERTAAKVSKYLKEWKDNWKAQQEAEAAKPKPAEDEKVETNSEPTQPEAEDESKQDGPKKNGKKAGTSAKTPESQMRAAFAKTAAIDFPEVDYRSLYFKAFDGRDPLELIVERCLTAIDNRSALDRARSLYAEGIKIDLAKVPPEIAAKYATTEAPAPKNND